LTSYPDYRKDDEYGVLSGSSSKGFFGENEYAHWSSNGTVAAFHFRKPQTGRFRSLLSSGFDLLYSPLTELELGRGRILLCQLDVTNRYGRDPVATLVVNRLLEYAGTREPKPADEVAWWGCPYWGPLLDRLHFANRQLDI